MIRGVINALILVLFGFFVIGNPVVTVNMAVMLGLTFVLMKNRENIIG